MTTKRAKPRLRGSIHLRVHPMVSLGLNLSDVVDLARDGLTGVRNALGKTPLAQRIRRKAAEKQRVRIAEKIVGPAYEPAPEDDSAHEEAESALHALGFKREQARRAVDAVREQTRGQDAKTVVAAALRTIR